MVHGSVVLFLSTLFSNESLNMNYLHQLDQGFVNFYDSTRTDYVPGSGVLFVAGTNTSGIHGKGAAKTANLYYGAPKGHYNGHHGRYYGIPTREVYWLKTGGSEQQRIRLLSLPLERIAKYVQEFVEYTHKTQYTFLVTAVGCGHAGYTDAQIAPMFKDAVRCWYPDTWKPYVLNEDEQNS